MHPNGCDSALIIMQLTTPAGLLQWIAFSARPVFGRVSGRVNNLSFADRYFRRRSQLRDKSLLWQSTTIPGATWPVVLRLRRPQDQPVLALSFTRSSTGRKLSELAARHQWAYMVESGSSIRMFSGRNECSVSSGTASCVPTRCMM